MIPKQAARRGADQIDRERIVIARQVKHLTPLVDDLLDVFVEWDAITRLLQSLAPR
jgi:hypothetical protein